MYTSRGGRLVLRELITRGGASDAGGGQLRPVHLAHTVLSYRTLHSTFPALLTSILVISGWDSLLITICKKEYITHMTDGTLW